jgi:glutamine synthetase
LVGFESEVIFLSDPDTTPPTPIDKFTYARTNALHSIDVAQMLNEIVASITEQGIGVTQFHPESAPGQV